MQGLHERQTKPPSRAPWSQGAEALEVVNMNDVGPSRSPSPMEVSFSKRIIDLLQMKDETPERGRRLHPGPDRRAGGKIMNPNTAHDRSQRTLRGQAVEVDFGASMDKALRKAAKGGFRAAA